MVLRSQRFRNDDRGAFLVVEAVLVAVIMLTAVLFFTSVQRPSRAGQEGSANLAQTSADTLVILRRESFVDPSGGTTPLDTAGWVTRIMAGDAQVAADVHGFVSQLVPAGARYAIRVNNGFGLQTILPVGGAGTPAGAQASEAPLFPQWRIYAGQSRTVTDGKTTSGSAALSSATAAWTSADVGKSVTGTNIQVGTTIQAVVNATVATMTATATGTGTSITVTIDPQSAKPGGSVAGGPFYDFARSASTIKCIRSPVPSKTTPTQGSRFGPGNATWISLWQAEQTAGLEHVPLWAPFGVWAGYTASDCSGTPAEYARVALPGAPTFDDMPMYGLQLVVWYGA